MELCLILVYIQPLIVFEADLLAPFNFIKIKTSHHPPGSLYGQILKSLSWNG